MKTLFSNKTNKKANSIFQTKVRIHARAQSLRGGEQYLIDGSLELIESELFRRSTLKTEYELIGEEPTV